MNLSRNFESVPEYTASSSSYFILDFDSPVAIQGPGGKSSEPEWCAPDGPNEQKMSVRLRDGARLITVRPVFVESDHELVIQGCALEAPNEDHGVLGPSVLIHVAEAGGTDSSKWIKIAEVGMSDSVIWQSAQIGLARFTGKNLFFAVEMNRPDNETGAGVFDLAICELSVARKDLLSLHRAQTFPELRAQNELAHFSKVYSSRAYQIQQRRQSDAARGSKRPIHSLEKSADEGGAKRPCEKVFTFSDPKSDETAFAYGNRLLGENLAQSAPDFLGRLRKIAADKQIVKVLSLCSGAARVEASMSAKGPPNVSWSLLDINEELLSMAALQFPDSVDLELIKANANNLVAMGRQWDIIICVSALHHIVELERVFQFIRGSLVAGGEFWSIGENIGRNGNRLWPNALAQANSLFRRIPSHLRRSSYTGQIDTEIPDKDFSVGCFEGIRSEEIESIANRWLVPVDLYRRNCFLWRILDMAYSDNYDLGVKQDVDVIHSAVAAELAFFNNGGRGTELYGVYRVPG